MKDRIESLASACALPLAACRVLQGLADFDGIPPGELDASSDAHLVRLANVLTASAPMAEALRRHPEWFASLRAEIGGPASHDLTFEGLSAQWSAWCSDPARSGVSRIESLRAFKRYQYLVIAYLDLAGLASFEAVVGRLSDLADLCVQETLQECLCEFAPQLPDCLSDTPCGGFAVFAMGKLGAGELNYSSDIDLVFCRRSSEMPEEQRFCTRLGERLVRELSASGPDGFLYRVDMRLRPHGETGPLVPTLGSLIGYYESWSEPWERQALIKVRHIAGDPGLGDRFAEFAARFTFSRPTEESDLEGIKQVKHRAEREYGASRDRFNVKQGWGGIRDIEFYVQFLQLAVGWKTPSVRRRATLDGLEALAQARVLLEGEHSQLSLAYRFLRVVEHLLQLRSLTPQAFLPGSPEQRNDLARMAGFQGAEPSGPWQAFEAVVAAYRSRVRSILERIYLTPGYLRLGEREGELLQLLSDRTPKERVKLLLGEFGFGDVDRAWQNLRLLVHGPAGEMLPPPERRAFLEFVFPLLEVLRDSVDADLALHRLESFASATGNRVSFLRALASRRPHLTRLVNLLAVSNRCHQILTRHPEFFDTLARGVHLHEGRPAPEMEQELRRRIAELPPGEDPRLALRRYRQREMLRIAYRDLAGLADAIEVSSELSSLASACVTTTLDSVRSPEGGALHAIAMGKLGSSQMHYASDVDLVFLYEPHNEIEPRARADRQELQEQRVEALLEILGGVTSEGVAYPVDLRLRPEGSSGLLARSWDAFVLYARQLMQPWERMALVRSRPLTEGTPAAARWHQFVEETAYRHPWTEDDFASVRHLKRRIEKEKSKESRINLDFKYGKGGIADLEFLVQMLQVRHGAASPLVRHPSVVRAIPELVRAGALSLEESERLLDAHRFQRSVENRYQLAEEWGLREVSRESPALIRISRSLGYAGSGAQARIAFLGDWDDRAIFVRQLVDRYFYGG